MSAQNSTQLNGAMEKGRPIFVDYKKFLSPTASRRVPDDLRELMKYVFMGGYTIMSGGYPNPVVFPIVEGSFTLRDGSVIHLDKDLMARHLQYGKSEGYPDLRQWLIEFQRKVHSPPTVDPEHPGHFDVIITNGSNEGLSLTFGLLLGEGDWAVCEEATYATAVNLMRPLGSNFQGVKSDKDGMVPEDLERVLSSWSELHPGCRKPKMLYVVTSGGNPTGVTWSLERKRAVYEIIRRYDLMIVEDGAYFFLQFNRPLVPTFLSMDVDGRVLRLDTMSKLVAPGFRVAMITGPAPLLENLRWQKDTSSVSPSGVSQMMLCELLRHWGHDGFLRHIDTVMEFYKQKAEMAVKNAERYLTGLAEWNNPNGGFFLWLRMIGTEDSDEIVKEALERRLLVVKGITFTPGVDKSAYIRVSFSAISEETCENGFRILAEAIKEFRGKKQ